MIVTICIRCWKAGAAEVDWGDLGKAAFGRGALFFLAPLEMLSCQRPRELLLEVTVALQYVSFYCTATPNLIVEVGIFQNSNYKNPPLFFFPFVSPTSPSSCRVVAPAPCSESCLFHAGMLLLLLISINISFRFFKFPSLIPTTPFAQIF